MFIPFPLLEVDVESFLCMRPDHIKEAIPSLGPRIKFETLYAKFLNTIGDVFIVIENKEKDETDQASVSLPSTLLPFNQDEF